MGIYFRYTDRCKHKYFRGKNQRILLHNGLMVLLQHFNLLYKESVHSLVSSNLQSAMIDNEGSKEKQTNAVVRLQELRDSVGLGRHLHIQHARRWNNSAMTIY